MRSTSVLSAPEPSEKTRTRTPVSSVNASAACRSASAFSPLVLKIYSSSGAAAQPAHTADSSSAARQRTRLRFKNDPSRFLSCVPFPAYSAVPRGVLCKKGSLIGAGRRKNAGTAPLLRNRTGVYVVFIAYRAALAFSQSAVNAAGLAMAISESIFRFMTMPAFLRPFMKRE